MKTHTIVCAWCKKVLAIGKGPISHGICIKCAEAVQKEMDKHPLNKKK